MLRTLVKKSKEGILYRKLCIQCIETWKSSFLYSKFTNYFYFCILNKCPNKTFFFLLHDHSIVTTDLDHLLLFISCCWYTINLNHSTHMFYLSRLFCFRLCESINHWISKKKDGQTKM